MIDCILQPGFSVLGETPGKLFLMSFPHVDGPFRVRIQLLHLELGAMFIDITPQDAALLAQGLVAVVQANPDMKGKSDDHHTWPRPDKRDRTDKGSTPPSEAGDVDPVSSN